MKKYCFVDMHLHTIFSNEEGVIDTPQKVLNDTLKMVNEYKANTMPYLVDYLDKSKYAFQGITALFGLDRKSELTKLKQILDAKIPNTFKAKAILDTFAKACISITDHNSILGSKEAMKLIKRYPNRYSCIEFIPGIEFNAGLKDLGVNEEGKSIYSKGHILAYGYDMDNLEMNIFSKLFQLTIGPSDINIGQHICASRNEFRKKYGVDIPLKEFAEILNKGLYYEKTTLIKTKISYNELRNDFIEICKKYLPEGESIEEFNNLLIAERRFPVDVKGDGQNAGFGKLTIKDVADIIHNANGKMVLAHPLMISINKKIHKDDKILNLILDDLIERIEKVTGHKLYGIEAFHSSGSYKVGLVKEVAERHGLYLTGGSDFHGTNHKGAISKCFKDRYEDISVTDRELWPEKGGLNRLIYLPIIENILYGTTPEYIQDVIVSNIEDGEQGWDKILKNAQEAYISKLTDTKNFTLPNCEKRSENNQAFEDLKNEAETPIIDKKKSNLWTFEKQWQDRLIKEGVIRVEEIDDTVPQIDETQISNRHARYPKRPESEPIKTPDEDEFTL